MTTADDIKQPDTFMTLSRLAAIIKETIGTNLDSEYWVVGEIAAISTPASGHCYLDLVEKKDDKTVAKIKAVVWKSQYASISLQFKKETGGKIRAGIKILMLCVVTYHAEFGLQLNIKDIDPRYTIGEMALTRQQIIERLTKEGLIDNNRKLGLPLVIQKIAIISSSTAAGYGDFLTKLDTNPYGYVFYWRLFRTYMQGAQAESTILKALEQCARQKDVFDAVVIIRGGGSTIDLSCFDNYNLAKAIATLPLPVLTGIGHQKDETVVDRVANMNLITPTDVADFIITTAKQVEDRIDVLRNNLVHRANAVLAKKNRHIARTADSLRSFSVKYTNNLKALFSMRIQKCVHSVVGGLTHHHKRIDKAHIDLGYKVNSCVLKEKNSLNTAATTIKNKTTVVIRDRHERIRQYLKSLKIHVKHRVTIAEQKIWLFTNTVKHLDPVNVLKRGYSITLFNGKAVKSASILAPGDIVETKVCEGNITSIVKNVLEGEKNEQ